MTYMTQTMKQQRLLKTITRTHLPYAGKPAFPQMQHFPIALPESYDNFMAFLAKYTYVVEI